MKLAILGTDQNVLSLVVAARDAGHSIVWLGDVRPEDAVDAAELLPHLTPRDDWELLLDQATADAVLVGRGIASPDLRAEQLKRLATDAVPLLVVHPANVSVLTYYEVDMARRESHGVVRHYTPLAGAPAVAELVDWVQHAGGPIGEVHQVICDREFSDCGRESVFRQLARDAELLRRLEGGIHSVNAIGPRSSDASYASLQVQMTGPRAATLRWSVAPASDGPPRARLTLVGERGTARLHMPADDGTLIGGEADGDWQLEIIAGGRHDVRPVTHWNASRTAIDELAAALPSNRSAASDAASTWSAATAAMEVVDALELSLQKGRTIEVHPQQLTEQLAFRGTMAAIGCGLLILGLAVLIVAGLFGDVIGLPLRRVWPWTLLGVLALFLLLQVVPWLGAKKRPKDEEGLAAGSSASNDPAVGAKSAD